MEIIDGKVVLSEKEVSELGDMLMWISRKYNGWSGLNSEDIEMELWVKCLEVLARTGKFELNYLARCSYNRAIDLCRLAKSVKSSTINTIDSEGYSCNLTGITIDDYSDLNIEALLSLFEENSKERRYVELMHAYTCKNSRTVECKCTGGVRVDLVIATELGYANDTSQGYRKLRQRVRDKLRSNL